MNGIIQLVTPNSSSYRADRYNRNNDIPPSKIAERFLTEYYRNVSNDGWISTIYLFNQNCVCLFKNENVGNFHSMLNYLTKKNAKSANYGKISSKWVVVHDMLVINVFGRMQFVSFNKIFGNIYYFTETFILKYDDNGYIKCTHYMFDF